MTNLTRSVSQRDVNDESSCNGKILREKQNLYDTDKSL